MAQHPDIDKRRRDLYAISLGLIVYNLAGGSLEPSATTLFGTVHLTRPVILFAGAWVAWAYFLWQFWLAASPFEASFLEDIKFEMQHSFEFSEYSRQLADLIMAIADRPAHFTGQIDINAQELQNFATTRQTLATIVKRRRFLIEPPGPRFTVSSAQMLHVHDGEKMPVNIPQPIWDYVQAKHPWAPELRDSIYRRARRVAAGRRHEFSDRVLPLRIALAAPLIQIARWCFMFITA